MFTPIGFFSQFLFTVFSESRADRIASHAPPLPEAFAECVPIRYRLRFE